MAIWPSHSCHNILFQSFYFLTLLQSTSRKAFHGSCHAMCIYGVFDLAPLPVGVANLGNALSMDPKGQSQYFPRFGLIAMPRYHLPVGRRRSRHESGADQRSKVGTCGPIIVIAALMNGDADKKLSRCSTMALRITYNMLFPRTN